MTTLTSLPVLPLVLLGVPVLVAVWVVLAGLFGSLLSLRRRPDAPAVMPMPVPVPVRVPVRRVDPAARRANLALGSGRNPRFEVPIPLEPAPVKRAPQPLFSDDEITRALERATRR
jgi:hypothetical protein